MVTNGMSDHARDGENANAALLVTLNPEDFPDKSTLGGMYWQRELEQAAFRAGGGTYRAPAQLAGDFLAHRPSTGLGDVQPTYRPGVALCDLHDVLPPRITSVLEQALSLLDARLHGFARPDAVLTAPETRSSSPVRIVRDETRQSPLRGLYPCGEGAGFFPIFEKEPMTEPIPFPTPEHAPDDLTRDELLDRLQSLQDALAALDDEEPEDMASDRYTRWADRHEALEDELVDVLDLLDVLDP